MNEETLIPSPLSKEPHAPADFAQRLRAVECPSDGVLFSIPAALFIRKSNNAEQIFCPNGHAFTPEKSGEIETNADRVILLTELLDAKNRIIHLEQLLAEGKSLPAGWKRTPEGFVPAGEDVEEIKRRARILRSRASLRTDGTRFCRLCGREIRDGYFVLHNVRRHALAVAQMPAEEFE